MSALNRSQPWETPRGGLALVLFLGLIVAAAGRPVVAAANDEDHGGQGRDVVGRVIDSFELTDHVGRTWHSDTWAERPLLVVAFLGVDCPLVRMYVPRLSGLARTFADRGVAFLGVGSNEQDSAQSLGQFADEFDLPFPLLKDHANQVANLFGAQRTPQVFVLDRDRVVRYAGRIDDQFGFQPRAEGQSGLLNYQRPRPARNDLAIAVEELLAGREVSVPYTEVSGCLIGRAKSPDPASPVTWSRDIAPLVQRHCQACHRPGQVAPFSLMSFEEARGWAEMMAEVVEQGRMPPWHANPQFGRFANDPQLDSLQRAQFQVWAQHGAPEGDPSDLPPPRHFTEGWQIPTPDLVISMSDDPVQVPAEGVVSYQYFVVDPQFESDVWVAAVECRPGNPAVVHHINVFVLRPEQGEQFTRDELTNELLWGYAPGFQPMIFAPEMAKRVPAGSQLVFQMHYTPRGRVEYDSSYIGIVLADPERVEREVQTLLVVNNTFEIPPRTAHHEVEAWLDIRRHATLYALTPHMHLRGKSFRYVAYFPDGRSQVLVDVPRYDFNWQDNYILAEPMSLPRGTRLKCVAVFDNSAENLSNPDPEAVVRWGDQTWEEMMIGYVHAAFDRPQSTSTTVATTDSIPISSPGPRATGRGTILTYLASSLMAALGVSLVWACFRRRRRANQFAAR